MKRFFACIICISIMLCSVLSATATDLTEADEMIRANVVSAFAAVSNINIDNASSISISDSYIRIAEEDNNGMIAATYIVGIEKNEDGCLCTLNPNMLAEEIHERGSYQQTVFYRNQILINRIYMTVTFTVTYSQYNGTSSSCIYRPNGISAYWSHGNAAPDLSVSTFNVYYDSRGDLVPFPACNTATDLFSIVITTDYPHSIPLCESDPTSGTVYSEYLSLPSNRALWFSNAAIHGSVVAFDIYTSQGRYSDSVSLGLGY